jgi:hypothetical protein
MVAHGNGQGKGVKAMDSIWVKIAGVAVVVVVVIVVLGRFGGDGSSPATQPQNESGRATTVYDKFEQDKQFGEEPKPVIEQIQPPPVAESQTPSEPPAGQPSEPMQPPGVILPSSITQPTVLHFRPLDETEEIQAQQLLPWAVAGRSIGRLPMMQYGPMVRACRDILQRWPESWYAFRAKQMLEEIAERYAANYNITPQEMDISRFMKPRRGTQPATVEPVQR